MAGMGRPKRVLVWPAAADSRGGDSCGGGIGRAEHGKEERRRGFSHSLCCTWLRRRGGLVHQSTEGLRGENRAECIEGTSRWLFPYPIAFRSKGEKIIGPPPLAAA